MITNITCEVMYDDGYGYIDLGSDDYFEIDEDNNLKITFDNTWITINDQVVPYYTYESTEKYSKGKVKILYNDIEANLVIVWNENNPNGKILGVELEKQYGNTTINSKGLKKLKNGDKIEFVCDYYSYDGEYEDSYILGDEIIVGDSELQVEYEDIGESTVYVYYKIVDVYNNVYYTEAVVYENN